MSSIMVPPLPPALPPEPISRLSVEQYHGLIENGLLADDDPVEFLEGWMVPKMPKKPTHSIVIEMTREAITPLLPADWFLKSENPITTDESEPEPDITAVRGRLREYLTRHPAPKDIGMIVEIADTTLARDRGIKKRIFARANIPVYWIVNLVDKQVEVYTDPSGPGENPDYGQPHIYKPGDSIAVILDGKEIGKIEVNLLLP